MAGSTISLDSLSSPSPSPSPPPETNKPTEPTSAGLDSDSELSELTEEEQETEKRGKGQSSGNKGNRNHVARRGRRPSRRGGRRKTSSMVPAPMWGWAETKSSTVVEEEEEEEMAGPPEAMEEEEDEEAGDDDEESLSAPPRSQPTEIMTDDPPEEELDDIPATSGPDNGASAPADDILTYKVTRPARRSARSSGPSNRVLQNDADITSSEDEATILSKNGVSATGELDIEEEVYDERGSDTGPTSTRPESDNGNETESDEGDSKESRVDGATPVAALNPKPANLAIQLTAALMDVDVDVTAPSPRDIAPLTAAAAASSIMAGSTIVDPPSPSSSVSGSRMSSRSPTPAPSQKNSERDSTTRSLTLHTHHELSNNKDASITETKATMSEGMDVEPPEADLDNERSGDENDADEVNMDDDLEVELESDLQPAHRAEALDVLALIELKFADLRERVYVEKMEGLAWEEMLVGEGTHPELIHLHKELSRRRDKRLELASHKRAYEIENVAKRRRADEDATWSWWMLARDELQTDMISESSRKRRRLERERRAIDRPQPIRRLPGFSQDVPPPLSLRKIVKSFPFGIRRNKRDQYSNPEQLIYPELSTLATSDIGEDLTFLLQTRDRRSIYDTHGNPSMNLGAPLGIITHQHSYDQYNEELAPPSFAGGTHRMPPFPHHLHGPPPLHPAGPGFPHYIGASVGRAHQPLPPSIHNDHVQHASQSQFPVDQEKVAAGTSQVLPQHRYFGSQIGPSGYIGGPPLMRRTPSPVNGLPNGKQNGTWIGAGMVMDGVHPGPGKTNGEWNRDRRRLDLEEEERIVRERDIREREKERERERELRDRERERERERDREREHQHDLERERRDFHQMQQVAQHRHPPPPQHQHLHGGPPPQAIHRHIPGPHHHHRPHHHHILHHHHGQSQAESSATQNVPPPPSSGSGSLRSPRSSREYDNGRSLSHSGHNQHPTEIINLSSTKPPHWKGEDHLPSDYARNKHGGRPMQGTTMDDRERPLAVPFVMPSSHNLQHPHIPPPNGTVSPHGAWNPPDDASYRIPPATGSAPPGYMSAHDPRDSPGHRYPNNSSGNHPGRGPTPTQQPRQNSHGLSPPRPRPLPPPSPSLSTAYPINPNPTHSPARYGPSPALPPNRSPPVSLKMRPPSPLANKMLSGPLSSGPPIPSVYSPRLSGPGQTSTPSGLSSPEIKNGLGAGNGPPLTYPGSSRTASPLMPFPSPSSLPTLPIPLSSRPGMSSVNGSSERERERYESPRLSGLPPPPPPPSKMSLPQMIDGH